jgi:hypothetical protein
MKTIFLKQSNGYSIYCMNKFDIEEDAVISRGGKLIYNSVLNRYEFKPKIFAIYGEQTINDIAQKLKELNSTLKKEIE